MRLLTAVFLLLVLGGCSKKPGPSRETPSSRNDATSTAQGDADVLGREVFDLVDRAMSYRSAHRGRLPQSLTELGVDALTPSTTRTLTVSGDVPEVTVGFRALTDRTVTNCKGTSAILEEASMGSGEFSVICTLKAGGTTTLRTSK